jgi:NADH-quinone oxidoreductase subunit G
MPRPEPKLVTFEIDGREVRAPEGSMLVDGAKFGDVEIPYFCYEPKLGQPVGACRMCLVQIEGIPKLQTACSTPVKEGMVVVTTSDRVKQAQNAIVEFLLVNHPLDCPVCDKGGECPLQDISFGWGPGRSRFIEPKRHFKKPLELSPLVAIDRERCILCYRCVRFSQEVAEDYQLVFVERADHTYVGTHDGHPYVAPFSGNIIELCPVGALTSTAYRFRARPWDVEDSGSVCTLCPSQCNIKFTVRDDNRVMRVLARDNKEVDDGWLCDKGRFGYQAIHSPHRVLRPMLREGGALREVTWEHALREAAAALRRGGERTAAVVGGEATNEEGFLVQRLIRDTLGGSQVDSRVNGTLDPEQARVLARPDFSVGIGDIDYAGAVLVVDTEPVEEMPILDLRLRKARRRKGVRIVTATSRPSSLDEDAAATLRFAPGAAEAALAALASALGSGEGLDDLARRAGADAESLRAAAGALRGAGPVVIVWSERLGSGARGRQTMNALLALARRLKVADTELAGLIEVPAATNARGLREVGCLPNMGPGLKALDTPADVPEPSVVLLVGADPLRTHPDREGWRRRLENASSVIAFGDFLDGAVGEHADVIFPAESYAEKDGTITHPDGRVQRVRQAITHLGEVRPTWHVLADLMERLGAPLDAVTSAQVSEQVFQAVPFYEGLTLGELGGKGVRWQTRDAARRLEAAPLPEADTFETPPELPDGLRLATALSLWSGREARHAPALRFLAPRQLAQLSPEDARRLGVSSGDEVRVSVNGNGVNATVALRSGVPAGTVVLIEGTDEDNATALTGGAAAAVRVEAAR